MPTITPEIQYQALNLFCESDSDTPQLLIDHMMQYREDLLDICGFFPVHHDSASTDTRSPVIVPIDGQEFGIDHDVFILPFHQTGTEQQLLDSPDVDIQEAYLIHLHHILSQSIKDTPLAHFYFRIKFNFNDSLNSEDIDNVILVSFDQLSNYSRLILGVSNVSSPMLELKERWGSIAFFKLRSELYQYALAQPEISKLWICIISSSLFIYYEIESADLELRHVERIRELSNAYVAEPLFVIIEPISKGIELIGEEDFAHLSHKPVLYDKKQWQFWLLNWWRIKKTTVMVQIQVGDDE